VIRGFSFAELQFWTRPSLHEGQLGVTVGDSLAPRLQKKPNRERGLQGLDFDLETLHLKLRPPSTATDHKVASRETSDASGAMRPGITPQDLDQALLKVHRPRRLEPLRLLECL